MSLYVNMECHVLHYRNRAMCQHKPLNLIPTYKTILHIVKSYFKVLSLMSNISHLVIYQAILNIKLLCINITEPLIEILSYFAYHDMLTY